MEILLNNKIFFWLMTIVFLLFSCQYQYKRDSRSNKLARQKIEKNLFLVSQYLTELHNQKDTIELSGAIDAMLFLEEVTNIISEAEGTFIGRLGPEEVDFIRWTNWYQKYQNYVVWDGKKIIVDTRSR